MICIPSLSVPTNQHNHHRQKQKPATYLKLNLKIIILGYYIL